MQLEINNKNYKKNNEYSIDGVSLSGLYEAGAKAKVLHKIGIEYERIPVYSQTGKHTSFGVSIGKLLQNISKNSLWLPICDSDNLIGLKNDKASITLEPGC